ncbi:hypothetical protein GOB57_21940 [Sinorhizobium meliloti]|nr:hypothetical protein [Sinorhizobium meliloti]
MSFSKVQMLLAARRVADFAAGIGIDIKASEIGAAYDHMGAFLTDTVLQAGLNYKTVVLPRVQSVLARYPYHYRTSDVMEIVRSGEASAFLTWTHGEKIARFESLATFLHARSVETVSDLRKHLGDDRFVGSVLALKGIGNKTVDYMGCLAGLDSVAVDRHIRTFAKRAGVAEEDYHFLRYVFCCSADLLGVSRRSFDAWVWDRESKLSASGR